jgi:hypothetical protein
VKGSKRRAARKPKLINVKGHQLTEAMYADYERCLHERGRIIGTKNPDLVLKAGLDSFLHRYRPSTKIGPQLAEITREAMALSLAVGAMKDYSWVSLTGSEPIRAAGVDLVKKLAVELYNASAKLTAIALSVEAEGATKLQDWIARDQEIARVGRGAEPIHG